MTKITKAVREVIKAYIDGTDYDVDTLRIGRDGSVSAIKSADKTFNGPETIRYFVGHIDDLLAQQAEEARMAAERASSRANDAR